MVPANGHSTGVTASGLTIRHAERTDSGIWLQLRDALWPSGDHAGEIAAYFDDRLAEPNEVLLAFDGDRAVALVELSIRHDVEGAVGVRTGYIEGLYVVPDVRAFGLNRTLVDAALDWAIREGCTAFASDRAGRVVVFRNPNRSRSQAPPR